MSALSRIKLAELKRFKDEVERLNIENDRLQKKLAKQAAEIERLMEAATRGMIQL